MNNRVLCLDFNPTLGYHTPVVYGVKVAAPDRPITRWVAMITAPSLGCSDPQIAKDLMAEISAMSGIPCVDSLPDCWDIPPYEWKLLYNQDFLAIQIGVTSTRQGVRGYSPILYRLELKSDEFRFGWECTHIAHLCETSSKQTAIKVAKEIAAIARVEFYEESLPNPSEVVAESGLYNFLSEHFRIVAESFESAKGRIYGE